MPDTIYIRRYLRENDVQIVTGRCENTYIKVWCNEEMMYMNPKILPKFIHPLSKEKYIEMVISILEMRKYREERWNSFLKTNKLLEIVD